MQKKPSLFVLLLSVFLMFRTIVLAGESPGTNSSARRSATSPRRGEILALQTNSITAIPFQSSHDDPALAPQTYALDQTTQVYVGRPTSTNINAAGQSVQNVKVEPGRREDLKVGQRVRILARDGKAVQITIIPEPPPPPKH